MLASKGRKHFAPSPRQTGEKGPEFSVRPRLMPMGAPPLRPFAYLRRGSLAFPQAARPCEASARRRIVALAIAVPALRAETSWACDYRSTTSNAPASMSSAAIRKTLRIAVRMAGLA